MPTNPMQFPRTKFVVENTAFEQAIRIHDEIYEVFEELTRPNIDYFKAAVETWDVIQAAETKLRILLESHGVDIKSAKLEVIRKNHNRGYYNDHISMQ